MAKMGATHPWCAVAKREGDERNKSSSVLPALAPSRRCLWRTTRTSRADLSLRHLLGVQIGQDKRTVGITFAKARLHDFDFTQLQRTLLENLESAR